MEEQVKLIRKRLAEANDRQKSYADAKRTPRQFIVGEKVLPRVKPNKSSIKFGKSFKLVPQYARPFEVVEIINLVAYKIGLTPTLAWLHDVFHVSYLKKYVSNIVHMIDWNSLQVQDPRVVMIEPIRVLEVRK
ncbi:uncharacterized protein LOC131859972 [Cryptomeria japonica]|uniref:uncharacterized protein LOC131859972 n=1 Tax=Cryptomeria japonica TaxID=3369 RepID=UPI0027DA3787|nr:uncharacterized protein LOC131859972 [Cryptomeria japonica]